MSRNRTPGLITDDDRDEIQLPLRWEICYTCHGQGKHSLAIDGNGLTAEDLSEWDEDQLETYFRGGYDRTCEDCDGTGKIQIVDEDVLTPEQQKLYADYVADLAEAEACYRMERRMGA